MSHKSTFSAVVLAAGQGTRMKSALPKVLHPVAGRPLVTWAVGTALEAGAERCVVVIGHGGEDVTRALRERFGERVETVEQPEQKGTGDAVRCGMAGLTDYDGTVVILYGDCPLIRAESVRAIVDAASGGFGMITSSLEDPAGYGRILRDGTGSVVGVREHRDCSPEELAIQDVNPGIYASDAAFLRESLASLTAHNAQGELYLTDAVAMAAKAGGVRSVERDMAELRGINDRFELALADKLMRRRINEAHGRAGVTIRDPDTTFIDADVEIGVDADIGAQVHLRGRCRVGEGAVIDVGSVLTDVEVAPGAMLKPYTVATESRVGEGAQVGPFSHLRPASDVGPDGRIGNFVEMKKTRLGRGSKANHLAYLGDGEIGEGVNVGAGTIFCNYDGFQKHLTVLEDGVFIGSDSQLVAPVRVGKGAYVASGSCINKDVPPDALAVARARQSNKEGYASMLRARFQTKKKGT